MLTEQVEIEINLSSTWWNTPPRCKVWIGNDVVLQSSEIRDPTKIVWKGNLTEGAQSIRIALFAKDGKSETILDETGKLIKDQLLHIDSISIDEINLDSMLHTYGKFLAEDGRNIDSIVNIGWNGTWSLDFQVPVYIWLLENM